MDRTSFFDAIDRAMGRVAQEEFEVLSEGKAQGYVAQKVSNVMEDLKRLNRGISPEYADRWLALFYLTWYQPGHIALGRELVKSLNEDRESNGVTLVGNRNLSVVDFGCGTLAMQFALLWAVSEALENGAEIESVQVVSYDPADPMIEIGRRLWKETALEIARKEDLNLVSHCIRKVIKPHYHSMPPQGTAGEHDEQWLSALHTIYGSNLNEARAGLKQMALHLNPDAGLLSSHHNETPRSLLRQAAPFDVDEYKKHSCPMLLPAIDSLPIVTKWRADIKEEWSIDHEYLDLYPVTSRCDAYGLIYARR